MSLSSDEIRAAIAAEREAIVKGIRWYFAPVDDPLYEDVRILCDRILRGEYSAPIGGQVEPDLHSPGRT